jgi:hypothetical protein
MRKRPHQSIVDGDVGAQLFAFYGKLVFSNARMGREGSHISTLYEFQGQMTTLHFARATLTLMCWME